MPSAITESSMDNGIRGIFAFRSKRHRSQRMPVPEAQASGELYLFPTAHFYA